MLDASGAFNTADWPQSDNNYYRPAGWRGGTWTHGSNEARVSDRRYSYEGQATFSRQSYLGGRGCR